MLSHRLFTAHLCLPDALAIRGAAMGPPGSAGLLSLDSECEREETFPSTPGYGGVPRVFTELSLKEAVLGTSGHSATGPSQTFSLGFQMAAHSFFFFPEKKKVCVTVLIPGSTLRGLCVS